MSNRLQVCAVKGAVTLDFTPHSFMCVTGLLTLKLQFSLIELAILGGSDS